MGFFVFLSKFSYNIDMEQWPHPSSQDGINSLTSPVRWRFLTLALTTATISFLALFFLVLFLESDWTMRINLIIFLATFSIPISIVLFWNTLYKYRMTQKQKASEEKNTKILEIQRTIHAHSWKLKTFLLESIEMEWWDFLSILWEHSNLWRVYLYAREKIIYEESKAELMRKMSYDISKSDPEAQEIMDIYDALIAYSKSLENLTKKYVECMPIDMVMALKIHHRSLFQEVLYEENAWVENEAKSMRWFLDSWMKHHLKEVTLKKQELRELLSREHAALSELLWVSHTMKEHAFLKVQTLVA